LPKLPNSTFHDVPYPVELQIKSGARIVSLSAAGWYVVLVLYDRTAHVTLKRAFFALDSAGSVYVWGEFARTISRAETNVAHRNFGWDLVGSTIRWVLRTLKTSSYTTEARHAISYSEHQV
jgi:hypothetical protein